MGADWWACGRRPDLEPAEVQILYLDLLGTPRNSWLRWMKRERSRLRAVLFLARPQDIHIFDAASKAALYRMK